MIATKALYCQLSRGYSHRMARFMALPITPTSLSKLHLLDGGVDLGFEADASAAQSRSLVAQSGQLSFLLRQCARIVLHLLLLAVHLVQAVDVQPQPVLI